MKSILRKYTNKMIIDYTGIYANTPSSDDDRVSYVKVAATYSPTWWGSTIGDGELNFSVRNGKRWILTAITATVYVLRKITRQRRTSITNDHPSPRVQLTCLSWLFLKERQSLSVISMTGRIMSNLMQRKMSGY